MAQFDASINLNVNNREALKGVTKVEGGINKLIEGVKEFERVFNDALNPKGAVQSRFQLDQERKALALFKQQNEALTTQFRLAAKLGRAYDKLQVKVVGTELRRLESARTSQKALPGRDQKLLPAAGQTSGTQFGGDITAAVRAEARVREAVLAEAERQLAADRRATTAKERLARAAQGEVSATTRTPGAPQPFGLLEPARGQRTTAAPVGSSGGSRYQQRLQAEVDRQIRVTGKLSNEILETVAKYNKVQSSADRLVKTQGRLSTELNKAAKTGGGGKKGGKKGGEGPKGDVLAGIGFPLLFGSGPGSIIGGALGSKGGFGAQILGSAIGAIIDQAIADVAKLGQAFTKTGLDADALSKAIGDLSGSTKKLIDETKEVSGSQAAAEAAAKLMSAAIGEDAVGALTTLGDATNDLSSAAATLNTEFAALAAQLLGPVAAGIAGLLERTNLINAAARFRKEGGVNADRIGAAGEQGFKEGGQQGAIDAQAAEAGKIIIEQRKEAANLIADANIKNSKTLEILETEGQILDINKNLLDTKTLELTKGNILLKYAAKLEKEGLTPLQKKVIEQEKLNELKGIDNKVTQQQLAADRKAEAAARKAANEEKRLAREAEQARKQELRVQQTLAQLDVQKYDTAIQLIAATQGQKAALEEQKRNTDLLLQKRIQILELSDKDARIQEKEKELLVEKNRLEVATINNKLQEISLQEKLNKLAAKQQVEGVQTQLDQELSGLSLGGNEQTDLLEKQANRYANTLREVNNEIETQKLLLTNIPTSDKTATDAALTQLETLEKTKSAYEAMLPQIFAAEQAQLKYNQTFAAISPAVNSLVGGLREVVAGTKTAEEAFADFLNTVADQLIQTAATMIAQYIALGIAKAFAFGGNPGGGSSGFNLSGGGSSVGSGGLPGIDSLGGLFNGSLPFIGSGRAGGGPVNGGSPYMVGEKGPELFIPGVSGAISNNDQFEAARNAMGGSSSGSSEAFAENTDSISTTNSYIRERSMERDNQTTVGGAGSMVIETQIINSTEYATIDQVQKASAAAAKQARAQVFNDMKNKPSRRAMVGLK